MALFPRASQAEFLDRAESGYLDMPRRPPAAQDDDNQLPSGREGQQPLHRRAPTHEPGRPRWSPRLLAEVGVLPLQALLELPHLGERSVELSIGVPAREDASDHVRHGAETVDDWGWPGPLDAHRAERQCAEHLV